MRALQAILSAAILVALCAITFELHRLANDLQIGADVRAAIVGSSNRAPETAAQHKARLDREAAHERQIIEDESYKLGVMLDTPKTPASKRAAPSR